MSWYHIVMFFLSHFEWLCWSHLERLCWSHIWKSCLYPTFEAVVLIPPWEAILIPPWEAILIPPWEAILIPPWEAILIPPWEPVYCESYMILARGVVTMNVNIIRQEVCTTTTLCSSEIDINVDIQSCKQFDMLTNIEPNILYLWFEYVILGINASI